MATIWRLPKVLEEQGTSRSTFYENVKRGLMTPPVKLGARAVGYPADEVKAVNAARIAGATEDQLRQLVARLAANRRAVMEAA